jgi:hypothetical protein
LNKKPRVHCRQRESRRFWTSSVIDKSGKKTGERIPKVFSCAQQMGEVAEIKASTELIMQRLGAAKTGEEREVQELIDDIGGPHSVLESQDKIDEVAKLLSTKKGGHRAADHRDASCSPDRSG